MKIGIFTNNYKPRLCGVAISIDTFTKELRRMGHKVYIFAPSIPGYKDDDEDVFRVPSIPYYKDKTIALPIPWVRGLSKLIQSFDVIHCQHPFLLGKLGARFAKKNHIPLVLTYHTRYEEYAYYAPFNQRILKKMIISPAVSYANRCDLVIVPTNGTKEILLKNGVKRRIERVPTGIELSCFENIPSGIIRHLYGIPDDTRILLYLGRIAKEKNLPFLIEAFKEVIKYVPSTVLMVVGYGPFEKGLQRLVEKAGLKEKVIFCKTPTRNDVYIYYGGGEIFIFSSLTETQGLVLCEALASGLPIVAINSISTSEVIIDGFNGYLTKKDPYEFSRCVVELLIDDEKRKRFSMASKEMAKEYSSKAQAQRLVSLYMELIRTKRDES